MNTFTVYLLGAQSSERIESVCSFVGEDDSGSFGLQYGHERFMTVLNFGLAHIRLATGTWEYLGIPGGLLYFVDNVCRISTRRYLRDTDVTRLAQTLGHELLAEEEALAAIRDKLHRLENEMLKRLVEAGRE